MKEQDQLCEEYPLQVKTDQVHQISYIHRPGQATPPLPGQEAQASTFAKTSQRREVTKNTFRDQQPFRNQKQKDITERQFQLNITPSQNKYNMTSSSFAATSEMKNSGFKTSRSVKYSTPSYKSVYKQIKIEKGANEGQEMFDRKQGISEEGSAVKLRKLDYTKILNKNQQTISQLQQIIRNLRRGNQGVDWREEESRTMNFSQKAKRYNYEKTDLLIEIENLLSMIQSNRMRASSNRTQYHSVQSTELRESRREQELKLQLETTVSNLTINTQRLEWQNRELLAANQKLIKILKREKYQQDNSFLLEKYTKYEKQIIELRTIIQKVTYQLEKVQADYEEVQNNFRLYIEEGTSQNTQQQNYRYVEIIETHRLEKQQFQRTIESLHVEIQSLKNHIFQIQNSQASGPKTGSSQQTKEIIAIYIKQIEQQRTRYEKIVSELTQKIQIAESKYIQIHDFTHQDNTDTQNKIKLAIDLFKKEIEVLKSTNSHQTGEIHILTDENNRLRNQLTIFNTNHTQTNISIKFISEECENLKIRCITLENNVTSLTEEIRKLQILINGLERQKWQLEERNIRLDDQLNRIKIDVGRQMEMKKTIEQLKIHITNIQKINVQLQFKVEEANGKLISQQKLHYQQITNIQQEITFKNQQINIITQQLKGSEDIIQEKVREVQKWYILYEKISNERASITYETLEGELKQLRAMISEFDVTKLSKFETQTIEEYYRLSYQHQLKIEENLKMKNQIEELKEQSLCQQRKHLQLSQTISHLQNKVELYEQQLKERKVLYEQLLLEKTRMQKEMFVSKKIKMEKSSIEQQFKFNVGQLTTRIDQVLYLQRERTYKWQQYEKPVLM